MANNQHILREVMAKAWNDKQFREKLKENPYEILCSEGMLLPDDVEFEILVNTPKKVHLVFPAEWGNK